jgi:lysophospholipase L1-like esterase
VFRPAKVLLVTICTLLALAIVADAVLMRVSHDYYGDTLAVRLDPAGLKVYEAQRRAPRTKEPLIVFFGDSRALMWSAPPLPAGYRIVNRGIGYQTTAQILLRLDADVVQLHPTVVVIEAGVNDLKAIADFPRRRAEIVADCEANLARIVDGALKAGAQVVLVTVFDIGHVALWRRPFWSNDVAASVGEVNAYLRSLAGAGVVLFDANPVLTNGGEEIEPAYQLDYLHLSSAGYEALNRKLVPLLGPPPPR